MDGIKLSKQEKDLVKTVREGNVDKIHCLLNKNPVNLQSKRYFDYYLLKETLICKNLVVAKFLISQGFRVSKNKLIKWEKTVLHYAAEFGDAHLIKILLAKGALHDIHKITLSEETPLHIAIRKRRTRVVQSFLSNSDPKTHLNDGCYLHCAIKEYNFNLFKLLLVKGLSALVKDAKNMTPFCLAIDMKNFKFLELLFSHYEIRSDHLSYDDVGPFFVASICGNLNFIKRTLNSGLLTVNSQVMPSSNEWFLLENCSGWTALHFAAKNDKNDVVEFLLNEGASVMIQDKFGNTPVHVAFEMKNYKILDLLLPFHINFNLNPSNEEGITHFHIACTRDDLSIVTNFMQISDSVDIIVPTNLKINKVNSKDKVNKWQGFTPLHFAVIHNKVKIVQLLLKKNASVNVKDAKGSTPLHLACKNADEKFREFILANYEPLGFIDSWLSNRNDHIEIINLLLQHKADVNCVDNLGNGALYYVCNYFSYFNHTLDHLNIDVFVRIQNSLLKDVSERREIILSMLLKFNINFDKCYKNGSILHYMLTLPIYTDLISIIKSFLQNGADVNATDDTMATPLHLAVPKHKFEKNKELIEVLINFKANVNCIRRTDQATPLHCVINLTFDSYTSSYIEPHCYIDIIELLLEKGADLYIKNKDGNTSLHLLVSLFVKQDMKDKISQIIRKYIKSSDQIDLKNNKGLTPLLCASLINNYQAVIVLLELGADINKEDYEGKTIFDHFYKIIPKGKLFVRNSVEDLNRMLDLGKTINILCCHVSKMSVVGKFISASVIESKAKLKTIEFINILSEDKKIISTYQKEINILKSKKINAMTTLYDILFKNQNAMANYVKNTAFMEIMTSGEIDKFEYNDLLKLKFNMGLVRSELLPNAKLSLNQLTGLHIPEYCSENIFKYFTNIELKNFITNSSLLEKEKKHTYSLRAHTEATKYQKV